MKIPILMAALGFAMNLSGQRPIKSKPSSLEIKKIQLEKVSADPSSNMSATQKKSIKEKAQAHVVYLTKAILHKADPQKYPWEDKMNPVEKRSMDAVGKLSPVMISRASAKIQEAMTDAAKMESTFGMFKDVDFTLSSLKDYMKKKGMNLSVSKKRLPMQKMPTTVSVVLRNLYCDQKSYTETGKNVPLITGVLIGSDGRTEIANSIISCEFNENEENCVYKNKVFVDIPVNNSLAYPMSFYSVITVVIGESQADAEEIIPHVRMAYEAFLEQLGNMPPEELAINIQHLSLVCMGMFLTDQTGVVPSLLTLELNGANALGADRRSDDLSTGVMKGVLARYYLGYYWQKIN